MTAQDQLARPGRGRPPSLPREQVLQIIGLRRGGASFMQIAIKLNRRGVPTPGGAARWGKQSVRRVLRTQYARDIATDSPS